jgi:hypothetical protein
LVCQKTSIRTLPNKTKKTLIFFEETKSQKPATEKTEECACLLQPLSLCLSLTFSPTRVIP